ncbi:fibronectin type III domain-containing protein [Streptomyces kanasensis]|uniref:fibronectin type III domain-containing protein n=1 Tax=Streptomyces kanasensis TaxID=936756 RepID=UPI003800C759
MITRTRGAATAATAVLALTGGMLTAAPASAAVSCASPAWTAQYFANATLSGTPKLTACDAAISENYGTGDPAGVTLPVDRFSVRWTLTRDFGSGGPFTFTAAAQDGVRVYLDGVRKIDVWRDVTSTQRKAVDLSVPAGRHTIRVDFAALTGPANVSFTYAPRTAATVDTVRPLAPTGATVTHDRATGKAVLGWAANKEMDLAGYRVYRRPSTTATWARLGGTALVTARSFTDVPPATGETYLYEVRAVDKAGRESLGSADLSVVSVDRTPPPVPAGPAGTDGPGGVVLRWAPVGGAARYTVERQRQPQEGQSFPVTPLATVTSATWTDTTAAERTGYTYRVRAVDAAGNASAPSAGAVVTRGDHPPAPPTALTAAPAPATAYVGVTLRWKGSVSDDVTGYRVYRDGELWSDGGARVVDASTTPRTYAYTDTAARYGATYAYTVVAVDGAGNESPAAAVSFTTEGDQVAPEPVAGLTATPREDGVLLEWQPTRDADLRRYDVYKGVWLGEGPIDGEDGWWSFHQIAWLGEDVTSHLHETPQDGETVRYAVVAVDDWGNRRMQTREPVAVVTVTELGAPEAD